MAACLKTNRLIKLTYHPRTNSIPPAVLLVCHCTCVNIRFFTSTTRMGHSNGTKLVECKRPHRSRMVVETRTSLSIMSIAKFGRFIGVST